MAAWTVVVLVTLGMSSGRAQAATVPVDALSGLGDEHVVFPTYFSAGRSAPSATVAAVGDVDGDGRQDTAVVLDSFDAAYPATAWVTFSPAVLPSTTGAGEPGWRGFRIVSDRLWYAVAGLGDVNGDGHGEVVVEDSDGIVVVFGQRDGATVDLQHLGDQGFRIHHVSYGTAIGFGTTTGGIAEENTTITDVGDQNGDGRPDLAFRDGTTVKVA